MSAKMWNCAILPLAFLCGVATSSSQRRPVTVADSIGSSAFGAPLDEAFGNPVLIYSPKHEEFVVITRKGVISTNTNRYTLTLFRTDAGPDEIHPIALFHMDSSSRYPAIDQVRWSADSGRLVFIGSKPHQVRQIYSFDLRSRSIVQLTHCRTDVRAYAATGNLGKLVYLADPAKAVSKVGDEIIVSEQTITSLLGGEEEPGALENFQLFVQQRGSPARRVQLGNEYPDVDCGLTISPDGQYATVALLAENRPETWKAYHLRGRWIVHYDLVDTDSRSVSPLLDAPSSNWRPELTWIETRSVVIAGTYLPLDETALRASVPETREATVEVRIDDHHLSLIASEPFHLIEWDRATGQLVLQDNSGKLIAYSKRGDTWRPVGDRTDSQQESSRWDIHLDQDMNTPPRLIGIEKGTAAIHVLFDPNPQFARIDLAKVQEIRWKTKDGRMAAGGIYLPVGYEKGKRYPLVIQAGGWSKDRFQVDGPSTAGYAAQVLAGEGFVVAQVGEPEGPWTWATTPQEGPVLMAMIEGLIDDLDNRSLIDRNSIGLFGWSRSGYLVRYTLAFSHYSFAAAVIAEGFDDGYFHYLTRAILGKSEAATYERIIGAEPFGKGIQDWVSHSSAFQLDKIGTPVRILGFSSTSVLGNWEWFAGLKYLSKAVEFALFPNAGHVPSLPIDRVAIQEGDLDWFRFWLKGEEDRDQAKEGQYTRWRALRKLKTADPTETDQSRDQKR